MKRLSKTTLILIICAVIALSACLSGCDEKEPGFPVALSNEKRSALELCTTQYKDSELETIYQFMKDGATVSKLNDKYAISCLRKDDDGYHVIYEGNKRILVLFFDAQGEWIDRGRLSAIYRMTETRAKFDVLQSGDNVSKVQTADPTCFFPFLAANVGEPLATDHYTMDGYHTHITYDEDFNIKSKYWELM